MDDETEIQAGFSAALARRLEKVGLAMDTRSPYRRGPKPRSISLEDGGPRPGVRYVSNVQGEPKQVLMDLDVYKQMSDQLRILQAYYDRRERTLAPLAYTSSEASAMLGISRPTLYALVERGYLTHRGHGQLSPHEVDAYVAYRALYPDPTQTGRPNKQRRGKGPTEQEIDFERWQTWKHAYEHKDEQEVEVSAPMNEKPDLPGIVATAQLMAELPRLAEMIEKRDDREIAVAVRASSDADYEKIRHQLHRLIYAIEQDERADPE